VLVVFCQHLSEVCFGTEVAGSTNPSGLIKPSTCYTDTLIVCTCAVTAAAAAAAAAAAVHCRAVWDIFARGEDTAKLSAWLSAHAADFPHMGVSQQPCTPAELAALGPINSQAFMLSPNQLAALQADTGMRAGVWACVSGVL
jgi:hypothetical protein